MIIMPLIENAFKHGGRVDSQLHIKFELKKTGNMYHFTIQNTLSDSQRKENKDQGIGLDILDKRLKLLYNQEYVLGSNIALNRYTVTLSIPSKHTTHAQTY